MTCCLPPRASQEKGVADAATRCAKERLQNIMALMHAYEQRLLLSCASRGARRSGSPATRLTRLEAAATDGETPSPQNIAARRESRGLAPMAMVNNHSSSSSSLPLLLSASPSCPTLKVPWTSASCILLAMASLRIAWHFCAIPQLKVAF